MYKSYRGSGGRWGLRRCWVGRIEEDEVWRFVIRSNSVLWFFMK